MARCVAAAELGCTIEEKRILSGQTVREKSAQIGKSLLSLWQSRIEFQWGLSCRRHAAGDHSSQMKIEMTTLFYHKQRTKLCVSKLAFRPLR
jgi:hypothetical protein